MFAVTLLVESGNEADGLPGSTLTVDGGVTNGELLDKVSVAPLAGAWPLSMMMHWGCAPPVIVLGEIVSDLNAAGSRLNCAEADPPLNEAVSVIGVAAVTCPACTWNWVQAVLPGIVIVGGAGNKLGFELFRLTVAPPAGTAAVNWTATHVVSPL